MLAREAIGLALVLEKYGAGLFGRGARPSGVLATPKQMGRDVLERLRVQFDNHRGADGAGNTLILEDGLSFTPHQLSSVDAQFLELRRFQTEEISAALTLSFLSFANSRPKRSRAIGASPCT
jgi:phage portal protein BeeE